jgi:hypothetical protein
MAGRKGHAFAAFDIKTGAHQEGDIGTLPSAFSANVKAGGIGDSACDTGRWIGGQIIANRAAYETVIMDIGGGYDAPASGAQRTHQ